MTSGLVDAQRRIRWTHGNMVSQGFMTPGRRAAMGFDGLYDITTDRSGDGTWGFQVVYDEPDYTHCEEGKGYATEQEARDAAVDVLAEWGLV